MATAVIPEPIEQMGGGVFETFQQEALELKHVREESHQERRGTSLVVPWLGLLLSLLRTQV